MLVDDCFRCRYYSWTHYLVCAVHPSGVDGDACPDFESDPTADAVQYRDFLGLGEDAEPIDNPWHPDPDENWAPPGTRYVDGELEFVEARDADGR